MTYLSLRFNEGELTIDARPHYCDRGNYLAKVFPSIGSKLELDLDIQDGWPRYFMDLERAKLECEAWLQKRGLVAEPGGWNEECV